MLFWQAQANAKARSRALAAWFVLLLIAVIVHSNALLYAGFYGLGALFGWAVNWRTGAGLPYGFFTVNTILVGGLTLGGAWLESSRVRELGAAGFVERLGGREASAKGGAAEIQALNALAEIALAASLPAPRLFILKEYSLNAMAVGLTPQDACVAITRGVLELPRDEMQAVLAHECGHIASGDVMVNLRAHSLVYGFSLIYGYGAAVSELGASRTAQRFTLFFPALVLMALGFISQLAGAVLQAAISRQREFLADAKAVQYQRQRQPLISVLRAIARETKLEVEADSDEEPESLSPAFDQSCEHFYFSNLQGQAWYYAIFNSHPSPRERIAALYAQAG